MIFATDKKLWLIRVTNPMSNERRLWKKKKKGISGTKTQNEIQKKEINKATHANTLDWRLITNIPEFRANSKLLKLFN